VRIQRGHPRVGSPVFSSTVHFRRNRECGSSSQLASHPCTLHFGK
jgi:hypothetical protein